MSASNRRNVEQKLSSPQRRSAAKRGEARRSAARVGVRKAPAAPVPGDSQSPENGPPTAQHGFHEYDLGIISLVLENVGLADLGLNKTAGDAQNAYSELFELADRFAGYRNQTDSEAWANRQRVRAYWEACVDMANRLRSVRLSLPMTIDAFAMMVVQLRQQLLIQERRSYLRGLGVGAMNANVKKAKRGGR